MADSVILEPLVNEITVVKKENKVILSHVGLQGASGGHFEHDQGVPANVWTIDHNLGYHPNITVVESTGNIVEGHYEYVSLNRVVATFSGAFSGKAYLS